MATDPASVATDAIGHLLDGGTFHLMNETGQVLATLQYGDPAFQPAENGIAKANPMVPDYAASRDGLAVLGESRTKGGEVVFQTPVGDGVQLSNEFIETGATVALDNVSLRPA